MVIRNRCRRQFEPLFSNPLLAEADHIVLALRWSESSINYLPGFLEKLSSVSGARIVVADRTAEFPNIPLLALDYGQVEGFDRYAAEVRSKELKVLNEKIVSIAKSSSVTLISRYSAVCNPEGTSCAMFDDNQEMLLYDEGHWSVSGAKYFGRVMRRSGQLGPLGMPSIETAH